MTSTHFHKKVEHSVALWVERVCILTAIPSVECSIHRHVFYNCNKLHSVKKFNHSVSCFIWFGEFYYSETYFSFVILLWMSINSESNLSSFMPFTSFESTLLVNYVQFLINIVKNIAHFVCHLQRNLLTDRAIDLHLATPSQSLHHDLLNLAIQLRSPLVLFEFLGQFATYLYSNILLIYSQSQLDSSSQSIS